MGNFIFWVAVAVVASLIFAALTWLWTRVPARRLKALISRGDPRTLWSTIRNWQRRRLITQVWTRTEQLGTSLPESRNGHAVKYRPSGRTILVFPSAADRDDAVLNGRHPQDCVVEETDRPIRPVSEWEIEDLRSWLKDNPPAGDAD